MRPLIGIPPCLDERGRWRAGRRYHYLDAAYAEALGASGACAVVLPAQEHAAGLAARLDGLLLPGGDDLLPDRPYPESVRFDPVPERQLAFDRELLAAALARDLPVLGICYGMQLLAVQRGGRLHYDLPTDLPEAVPHALEPEERHEIEIEAGSRLAGILGAGPASVNSRHHQAVADPGPGARAVARSRDGLIEALELDGFRFALGVQWHPETLGEEHRAALFGAFAAACREHR